MKQQLSIISLTLVVIWIVVLPAGAESPTAYVRGILDKTMAVQNAASLDAKARSRAIHQIIAQNFDFPMMAKDTRGPPMDSSARGHDSNSPIPSVTCSRLRTPAWFSTSSSGRTSNTGRNDRKAAARPG